MEQVRNDIFLRDHKLAFNNAIALKLMTKPEDYMYMYTRRYADNKLHDVFKHRDTRRLETVLVEGQ
tara:strand:- start:490 stop:687 length:198 start_codon:yes stop_codon:yes gene_type:complete